jgi:hypothetical protein
MTGVASEDQGSNWGDSALRGEGVPGSGDGSGNMSERALKESAPIEIGVFRGSLPQDLGALVRNLVVLGGFAS